MTIEVGDVLSRIYEDVAILYDLIYTAVPTLKRSPLVDFMKRPNAIIPNVYRLDMPSRISPIGLCSVIAIRAATAPEHPKYIDFYAPMAKEIRAADIYLLNFADFCHSPINSALLISIDPEQNSWLIAEPEKDAKSAEAPNASLGMIHYFFLGEITRTNFKPGYRRY